jgi:quercetin dioxygenase-like cupin family protein
VAIIRVFTGEDGESHFEDLDPPSHPILRSAQTAVEIEFKAMRVGYFNDWHTAPRRQYVITLSGEAEVGIGDGTVHRFRPGDVLLADDLIGRGHTMRTIGDQPHLTAQIRL